ncbi:MAG TPA: PAS domain S-box protein [Planktothrix sp.]|jgi:PAS domain S-box-containing protein
MSPSSREHAKSNGDPQAAAKLARIAQLEAEIANLKKKSSIKSPGGIESSNQKRIDASNANLRSFFNSNLIPIFRCDIHGNVYEVNDAMINLLGYSREEFLSGALRWTSITPPEDLHLDEQAIHHIRATGQAPPWEKHYICKDGTRRNLLIGVVAADRTGNDCLAFCIDITDRKRLQAELRASEAKFRMLAEAIPNIVWLGEGGRVIYHNSRFYEYTGRTREEEDGLLWTKSVHPDDLERVTRIIADATSRREGFEIELRMLSKEGEYRWHLSRGTPLVAGDTVHYFGTAIDIDDTKQLREELRESEVRFNTLANAIPQIVWTAQPGGRIDFFNDRWLEYTGLTTEQSENDGWQLLIHPDDLDEYMSGWKHALMTGDSFETEFRLKRALFGTNKRGNLAYRWHLCRAVALRDSHGQIIKWFASWTEIEDQKRS